MKKLTRNQKVAAWCLAGLIGMFGLAYASVPLYRLFCQVTGFDGTTQRAEAESSVVLDRKIRVYFDTNANNIPWSFKVEHPVQNTLLGKTNMIYFTVRNDADVPLTGRASYNVLPEAMGGYFMKLQCFCFTDQTLQPGEERTFPVVYYVDPKMLEDIDAKNTKDVTLSYTFFPSKETKK
ncbi:cytochrome c oxidase assembly protein [Asticcacaulis excentricus]|uniref:Cytochrome c oxidase assembly protein CtaG n=1 Tax=Asticcacaulis excentricus (strain ATCC 15261 / DSM 4724 / KCTC 12464 / NCIMB 9791 / VKM B-1370 / CB 48) TaxID=573065 RepID=E8RV64_ASTEC|nr:cytochrome c oxidase assembly protein [Asticcacaulis excentricus]ADU14264.1 cytochrome c oxidase assembly protein CtaG/Cox11 [Asticcacaulis excentricus CB 48]